MAEAQWYVAHTYSGYENKVKVDLEKTIENLGLQDQILEVSVPMESVLEIKGAKEKLTQKKLFPGYVFIHMYMNDETWYIVRNTRGVTGFVGPGSKPVPLTEAELRALGYIDNSGLTKEERLSIDFEVGDSVVVISGAWQDTIGEVSAINHHKKTLTISVEMFGRSTKLELDFKEVKKM